MKVTSALRMTGVQHSRLMAHLFPGDGKEAVAIALCGRSQSVTHRTMLVQQMHFIPHEICHRTNAFISWPTDYLLPLLDHATDRRLTVVKIHSHPGGFPSFSAQDDRSDTSLFPFIWNWTAGPHASVVILPDGSGFGREVE